MKIENNNSVSVFVLRALLLGVLIISLPINMYLNINLSDWSVCFLIGVSILTSFLFMNIYQLEKNSPKFKKIQSNTNAAQEVINSIQNKFFNYKIGRVGPNLIPKSEKAFSLIEVLEEPFNWILCIALFASLFMTPTYRDFDINNAIKLIKFSIFTLMQIVLMSFAISGVVMVTYKKFKGENK